MDDKLSNYDKRQLLLLKDNKISLKDFLETLEGLLNIMENVDSS